MDTLNFEVVEKGINLVERGRTIGKVKKITSDIARDKGGLGAVNRFEHKVLEMSKHGAMRFEPQRSPRLLHLWLIILDTSD